MLMRYRGFALLASGLTDGRIAAVGRALTVVVPQGATQVDLRGKTVAMGTDSGAANRFQGYFEHMELELMVKAGLTASPAVDIRNTKTLESVWVSGEKLA